MSDPRSSRYYRDAQYGTSRSIGVNTITDAYASDSDSGRSISPSLQSYREEVSQYMVKRESSAYRYYPGVETLEVFDYMDDRRDLHNTNLAESIAHVIKGSLGAGVLSMHEAFMYGGLWTSLITTFVIGFLIYYAMSMLGRSAHKMYRRLKVSKLSYPDLAEVSLATGPFRSVRRLSKTFRYTVDTCLFLDMCGTCCVYQIMIAHTLKNVVEGLPEQFQLEYEYGLRIYILFTSPVLILLCMIRSLKFLAPFSMVADLFIAICVLTTLYYSMRSASNIRSRPGWKDLQGFVRFCGICLYCTSGVSVALPIENNMKKPRYYRVALRCGMTIVILLISITGFFGYWGWGEVCKSPITVHMPLNFFTTVLQCLLLMMLSTTFAVAFWVPFRIIWFYIGRRHKRKLVIWERFYRVIMALLVTAVSTTFPNLIPVMVFLGHFFLGFIAFVFPAFIELLVTWSDENVILWRARITFFKDLFIILFGLILSGSAFYAAKH
ncbi:unnamed protein product [Chrysodeixis includens]|uniref:Amino acid transporter transmembrane domain-containing protein n=1 Tax=Chrysodeixis includens TaxID=689277 RepID=A0A9P0BZS7_CHRIL|nr:unnamed protein product [Chrysodeixis includens]